MSRTILKNDGLYLGGDRILDKEQTKRAATMLNVPKKKLHNLKLDLSPRAFSAGAISSRPENHSFDTINRSSAKGGTYIPANPYENQPAKFNPIITPATNTSPTIRYETGTLPAAAPGHIQSSTTPYVTAKYPNPLPGSYKPMSVSNPVRTSSYTAPIRSTDRPCSYENNYRSSYSYPLVLNSLESSIHRDLDTLSEIRRLKKLREMDKIFNYKSSSKRRSRSRRKSPRKRKSRRKSRSRRKKRKSSKKRTRRRSRRRT